MRMAHYARACMRACAHAEMSTCVHAYMRTRVRALPDTLRKCVYPWIAMAALSFTWIQLDSPLPSLRLHALCRTPCTLCAIPTWVEGTGRCRESLSHGRQDMLGELIWLTLAPLILGMGQRQAIS